MKTLLYVIFFVALKEVTAPDKPFDNYRDRQDPWSGGTEASSFSSMTVAEESGAKGKYEAYMQRDDIDSGKYDNYQNMPNNSCTRICRHGEYKICYYRFNFEPYIAMGKACNDCISFKADCYAKGCVTADGYERAILTINRRMPGPSIQVCEGDTIIADVVNLMPGRSTVVHWHGVRQRNYKFMDGVPMITQCPITEAQTFRYIFRCEDPGLHFYHSHDGLQKVDGIVGGLVIRQPRDKDINSEFYDFDLPSHVMVIQDWYHMAADSMFPGLRYRDTEQMATSYLIQGRGQFMLSDGSILVDTPISIFNVTGGYRYVFRIIAGTCYECQYVFTIEKHSFYIIGGDALPTKPYHVNSLTMSPGERYSVVVNCDKPVSAYWIQVRTVGLCGHKRAYQIAILRYRGGPNYPPSPRPTYNVTSVNNPGITVSPVNSNCTSATRTRDGPCLHDLRGAVPAPPEIFKRDPDVRLIWAFGFYFFRDAELFSLEEFDRFLQSPNAPVGSTINGIVNMFPPSPLLSQPKDVPQDILCPDGGFPSESWNMVHRECVHIFKVPTNALVEIVTCDFGRPDPEGISHGIHLHGYEMFILEMGIMPQNMTFANSLRELLRRLDAGQRKPFPPDPVTKDTFPLSSGGYVVKRFIADNPGFWFFHCHFAYHLDSGMSGVLQVGENSTFPPPPYRFPRCGDYLP